MRILRTDPKSPGRTPGKQQPYSLKPSADICSKICELGGQLTVEQLKNPTYDCMHPVYQHIVKVFREPSYGMFRCGSPVLHNAKRDHWTRRVRSGNQRAVDPRQPLVSSVLGHCTPFASPFPTSFEATNTMEARANGVQMCSTTSLSERHECCFCNFWSVPMVIRPLAGDRLLRRARGMRLSALGLDGWSMKDMRSMPLALLAMLADFLHMVEQTGHWPAVHCVGAQRGAAGGTQHAPSCALSRSCRSFTGCGRDVHPESHGLARVVGAPRQGGLGKKNSWYRRRAFFWGGGYPRRRGGVRKKIRAKFLSGPQKLKCPQLYPTSFGLEGARRIFFKVSIDVSADMGGICVSGHKGPRSVPATVQRPPWPLIDRPRSGRKC